MQTLQLQQDVLPKIQQATLQLQGLGLQESLALTLLINNVSLSQRYTLLSRYIAHWQRTAMHANKYH